MVKVIKKSFVVIGKEGSTLDGEGFIQKLWDDANSHFGEVAHLAKNCLLYTSPSPRDTR